MRSADANTDLVELLRNGESKGFEIIYDLFADRLYDYVLRRVAIEEVSEEIVQEIFVSLWSRRATLEINISLDAYLFGAAKLSVLAYMRSQRVRQNYAAYYTTFMSAKTYNSTEDIMNVKDLQERIDDHISQLPERCQIAFRLSRLEHEPIPAIAERMKISTGTVENYLSRALKHLRTSLDESLLLLILWIAV